jgi:hypothetical protein
MGRKRTPNNKGDITTTSDKSTVTLTDSMDDNEDENKKEANHKETQSGKNVLLPTNRPNHLAQTTHIKQVMTSTTVMKNVSMIRC